MSLFTIFWQTQQQQKKENITAAKQTVMFKVSLPLNKFCSSVMLTWQTEPHLRFLDKRCQGSAILSSSRSCPHPCALLPLPVCVWLSVVKWHFRPVSRGVNLFRKRFQSLVYTNIRMNKDWLHGIWFQNEYWSCSMTQTRSQTFKCVEKFLTF